MKQDIKIILIAVFSGLIALFLPSFKPILAFDWGLTINTLGGILSAWQWPIYATVVVGLWTVFSFAVGALALQSKILEWVLSDPLKLSYTNPNTNPVISIGWTTLRDLTNMLFILGLAYIGLATALNLSNFQTKKTFSRLIIVALLINFTPVICGLIVDASNIIMSFFTADIWDAFSPFGKIIGNQGKLSYIKDIFAAFSATGLLKMVTTIIYLGCINITFFVFNFLLLARYVAIWFLVIISPLAFFCWIFRETEGYFKKWWNQFIQWAFIGIGVAFVLYLSGHLLQAFGGKSTAAGGENFLRISSGASGNLGEVVLSFIPLFIVIIFMLFGITQILSQSAAGANTVTNFAIKTGEQIKSGGKKVGRYAWAKAKDKGSAFLEKRGPGSGSKVGTFIRWMTKTGTEEEEAAWNATRWTRAARTVFGGAGLSAVAVKKLSSILTQEKTRYADEVSKKAGETLDSNEAALRTSMLLKKWEDATIILEKMIKNGNYARSDYVKRQLPNLMEYAIKNNPEAAATFKFMDPKTADRLTQELKGKVSENNLKQAGLWMDKEDLEKYGSLAEKLFATIKPSTIENWTKETANEYLNNYVHNVGTGAHIQKIIEVFGRSILDKFAQDIAQPGAYKKYVENGNMALGRWILSGAAANLGISYQDNDKAKEFFKGEEGRLSAPEKEEYKKLAEKAKKGPSETEIIDRMSKYRTEEQLKREEYKHKEFAALTKEMQALRKTFEKGSKLTVAELKKLSEISEKAEEEKTKAINMADFYGRSTAEKAFTTEEKKLTLKEEKEIEGRAISDARKEKTVQEIKKEARRAQKELKKKKKVSKKEETETKPPDTSEIQPPDLGV